MTKFELVKNTREVKSAKEIKKGCTLDQRDQYPEILQSFSDKAEALEALKKYKSSYKAVSGFVGMFFEVTEYYVEENEYDEDGEWCAGGDVWAFAEFENQEEND